MRIASIIARFYEAVRTRKRPMEDARVRFARGRSGAAEQCGYFEKRICHWDPHTMTAS